MIFITGDKHGSYQLSDLDSTNWPEGHLNLTKNDYLIIAGDFGGVFHGGERDKAVLDFYESQPWTTLFVDGNHENFDLLSHFPVSRWKGGNVQYIRPSILHLMRGQIYTIEEKNFFTMGGAVSMDKGFMREDGFYWWKEELPSWEEYLEADENLAAHNNKVDYIITHTCSARLYYRFAVRDYLYYFGDGLTEYFNDLEKRITFKHWYFGHHHQDIEIDDNHTMLCRKVVKI